MGVNINLDHSLPQSAILAQNERFMSGVTDENREALEQKFVQVLADIQEKRQQLGKESIKSNFARTTTFMDRINALKKMREPTDNTTIIETENEVTGIDGVKALDKSAEPAPTRVNAALEELKAGNTAFLDCYLTTQYYGGILDNMGQIEKQVDQMEGEELERQKKEAEQAKEEVLDIDADKTIEDKKI